MLDHDPLVSVVVPAYNMGSYICETLSSVVEQSYRHLEIVVVNPSSTDSTVDEAARFVADRSFRPTQILTVENRGPSWARNKGITAARGEVILCLDGDDQILPGYIEQAVQRMRATGASIVCSSVELFGTEVGEWIPDAYDPFFIRYNNMIPTASLFHRSLWEKVGGFAEGVPFAEDWNFWINCSRHSPIVERLDQKFFRYRRSASGLHGVYMEGEWDGTVSLVMLANQDLYNVEDLRFAMENLRRSRGRAESRIEQYRGWFPQNSLLCLAAGLFAAGAGNSDAALPLYLESAQSSQSMNWLPLYQIAGLCQQRGQYAQARQLLHQVRILRPDTHFILGDRIQQLERELR